MSLNLNSLKQGVKQNLELIGQFEELIALEEKCVAEGSEPIDMTFFKKFNTIQHTALDTCMKLIEKHEAVIKQEQEVKDKEAKAKKEAENKEAAAKKAAEAKEKAEEDKRKKEAEAGVQDLFSAFDEEE